MSHTYSSTPSVALASPREDSRLHRGPSALENEMPAPNLISSDWPDSFIVAHVGAGYHAPGRVKLHKSAAAKLVFPL